MWRCSGSCRGFVVAGNGQPPAEPPRCSHVYPPAAPHRVGNIYRAALSGRSTRLTALRLRTPHRATNSSLWPPLRLCQDQCRALQLQRGVPCAPGPPSGAWVRCRLCLQSRQPLIAALLPCLAGPLQQQQPGHAPPAAAACSSSSAAASSSGCARRRAPRSRRASSLCSTTTSLRRRARRSTSASCCASRISAAQQRVLCVACSQLQHARAPCSERPLTPTLPRCCHYCRCSWAKALEVFEKGLNLPGTGVKRFRCAAAASHTAARTHAAAAPGLCTQRSACMLAPQQQAQRAAHATYCRNPAVCTSRAPRRLPGAGTSRA